MTQKEIRIVRYMIQRMHAKQKIDDILLAECFHYLSKAIKSRRCPEDLYYRITNKSPRDEQVYKKEYGKIIK